MDKTTIPLTVPSTKRSQFRQNYSLATGNSGRLLMFAGDQKVEHLNGDFFGKGIAKEDASPEHLFKVASQAPCVLATHLGLIAAYGQHYKNIPYIVKLNGRTNLFSDKDKLLSSAWNKVENIVKFKKDSGLKVVGIGYTIYLGGEYESKMLKEAAKVITQAHENGLLAVIWMYPRNKAIKNDSDPHLLAGAAGVAVSLGADFVKIKYPETEAKAKLMDEAILAAGRTKVIFAGGSKQGVKEFLNQADFQINSLKAGGLAVGRNIHQRSEKEAISFLKALGEIVHKGETAKEAYQVFQGKAKPSRKKRSLLFGLF